MAVHELKITPSNFEMVISGGMTFQIRKSDRDFKQDDIVFLKEFSEGSFTGRTKPCKVNLVLTSADGLQQGYVLLNIKLLSMYISREEGKYETRL